MANSSWMGVKPIIPGLSPLRSSSKRSCPKTIRDQLRNIYWKGKHEGPCFCCGKKIYDSENTEAGRIKAGGKYSVPNTRLICKTCNRGMGKQNLKVYMKRNYPERYKKYFSEKDKNKTNKKKLTKRKPSSSSIVKQMQNFKLKF